MFKVGDLVEWFDDSTSSLGAAFGMKKGDKYTVLEVSEETIRIFDEQIWFHKTRFKLAEQPLKVGDKVKSKMDRDEILTILELTTEIAFLEDDCGTIFFRKIKDLEKVEEKVEEKIEEREAPPKYTKIYVWDGDKRPERPKMRYSFGELNNDGKIKVCAEFNADGCIDERFITYENWEVCV